VIVGDFNVERVGLAPHKAYSPLVVDPDTVLTLAVAAKFFQSVSGRNPDILQRVRVVQHRELAPRDILDALKTRASASIKERFRVFASERSYHAVTILRIT